MWEKSQAWAVRRRSCVGGPAAGRRRDGVEILAAVRHVTTSRLLSFSTRAGSLEAAGFAPEAARGAMIAIGRYVMGSARSENAGSDADFAFGLETLLDGLEVRLARMKA